MLETTTSSSKGSERFETFIILRFLQAYGASVGSVVGQAMTRDSYRDWELSYMYASVAMVMAVAMFANLIVAGLSGTVVPVGLLRLGVDPAVASSVFITTITDVVGFFVFLGLAALYLI